MKKDDIELPSLPDISGYRANLFDPDVTAVEVNTAEDLIKAYAMDAIEPYKQRIEELEEQLEAIGAGGVSGQRITSQCWGEPVSKTNWNTELSSWSDDDFVLVFHERPDLADRLRKILSEPVSVNL